jgi:NADH-quinone oxidoreductase subunit M
LIGTYKANPVAAALGFTGLVFGVIYVLRMVQDSISGKLTGEASILRDLDAREIFILGVLAVVVLLLGLWPQPVLGLFKAPVSELIKVMTPYGVS